MYEVFTVDLQSEPGFEELIFFDSLPVALAYSKVRVLFSAFASCSVIWDIDIDENRTYQRIKRKKLYKTFWHNRDIITIEPGHELFYYDNLLPFVLAKRESSGGMQKRSRKRWADLSASRREE